MDAKQEIKQTNNLEPTPLFDYKGINKRWEMLQAGAIKKDYRLSQHRQEWSQFKADLDNMMAWLDEAEALQRTHKPLPGEITKLDSIIRQHKVGHCL